MERKINISVINKKHTLVIFCVLFAFFANLRISYSQNIVPNPSYCNSDPPVTFIINNPTGKTWTSNVPGVIVNTFNGEAVFSPALVPGPYPRVITILYQKSPYAGEPAAAFNPLDVFFPPWIVTITIPPNVTFAAIADVCVNAPIFPLSPRGNPTGGIYAGPGVDAGGFFHPAVAGAGTHSISYTYPTTGCSSTTYQMVTVKALPPVSLAPLSNMCIDAAPMTLTTGSPGGGTYTGTGVADGMFNPGAAGVGIHTITYTFSDGLCTNSASRTITVNALPSVTIGGLYAQQCDTDPPYTITGFPTGVNGTFNGNGITDNNNGTAVFNPGNSGLGLHNIIYSYTDVNGCSNSNIQITRVGTELFMYGLTSNYCANEPVKSFTYTPANSTNPLNRVIGTGIIDNLDGTATFNPGIAAIGNNTITYTFWDDIGCENIITKNVFVADAPVADFSGLNASLKYCFGSIDLTLTGNHPGGSFTGPVGCIVDNGDGTAIFRPSVLTEGIYSITYSYTNSSGCTGTVTKNVEILPLPTIFNVTGGGAYCSGTGGNPVGLNNSTAGVNYQLFRDGFAVVPINIKAGDGNPVNFGNQTVSGAYTVVATNAVTICTRQMNGSVSVSVTPQAAITTLPLNETVCETGSAVFLITASGQNINYAWTKNGAPVGGNSNILAINGVTMADNGHLIVCTVTSTCPVGFSNSSPAVTLTVNPNTTIITHPSGIVKCTGTSHTFSVAATGVNNTYLWKRGATDILETPGKYINAGTANLTILNLTTSDAGNYTCYINGICGSEAQSNPATLQVIDPIVITSQPVSLNPCTGTNVSFSTVATPAGLSYQWYFNNGGGPVSIAGATSSNYPIFGVAPADAGTYYCTISSSCGATVNTNLATLTIPNPTVISANPSGSTVCQGGIKNFSVTASGSNLTYQWIKDGAPLADNAKISGSKLSNLTLSGVTLADAGNYVCLVSGDCGILTTPAASLIVEQAVTFISQPTNKTVCPNSAATFSVSVNGSNLTYEWQKNTIPIIGASNPDYTIIGATAADAGNYRCKITNACGNIYSNEVSLTVNTPTTIITQPVNVSACENLNVSFSVVASGTILTYQWYKNAALIGGATNSVLNLINITTADAASYYCIVTGTCNPTQISNPGVLTVDIPVVISTHPQPASVCFNTTHELNIVLSAGTNPTYQWYFDNNLDGIFVPVGGATSQILTINTFDATEAGDYYCVVTNGCGSANSQNARLTLIDVFNITSGIADASVCENGSMTYTIAADQPVSFRWMKNGISIPGATTASLVLNNIPFADNGAVYSCEVYNNCKSQIVSSTLTVSRPLSITTQPQNGTACPASPYSINIVSSGTNPQYQWYKAPASLLFGKIASSLSFVPFASGDAGTYYCIITNGCGSVISNNTVITAGIITAITTDPVPLTYCTGNDATFTVATTGTNLTYSWRKNHIPLVDNGRIVGSNTNTLTINDIVAGDEETYDVIVTGTCGLATSAGAFLDVRTPLTFTDQPDPITMCSGGNASFRVTVPVVPTDPIPTYQWQLGGNPINTGTNPSAATSTLNIIGAVTGGIFNCVVTNFCGSITSTSAELIIEENVDITGPPAASQTKCQGSNVSFTAVLTGPTDMTLQWYKEDGTPTGAPVVDGIRISGATLPTLMINNIAASDAGRYFLRVTSSCGTSVTNSGELIVQERITITQQPQSITVCPAGTLTLNVIATGTVDSYTWKLGAVVVGTGPTYSVSPFVPATQSGNYTVELNNICETVVSDIAVVSAGIPTAATISANLTECQGQNASFTVTATGSNLTYKWYKGATILSDGVRIGGSITATLTITGLLPSDAGTYQCDVSGSCGFDNDNSALLTVNSNISIGIQPSSTSALVGTNPTFTVVVSGSITGYQWYKGAGSIADGALYSGTSSATLTVLDAQAIDAGAYSCIISGICGNVTSNTANLTVIPASLIVTQPTTPVSVCETSNFSLNIVATPGAHTYKWRQDGIQLVNGARISGATTSVLNITGVVPADAGAYTCLLDDTEISSASIVTVDLTTNITAHPAGGTKCVGDMHIFSVTSSGANLTYQWYKNNLASPIGGALSNEYTISPLAIGDNGTYFCVVTGTCGQKTSNPATLVVNPPISIVAQPAVSTTVCQGNATSLLFNVTGTNLSYVWNKNGQPITDGNITGMNTNTLVITGSVVLNSGSFTCTVSGLCSIPVTSNTAAVTVNPTTAITTQPISHTLCEGANVTFTIAASGINLTYDWRRNGASLGLPSSPSITISGLVKATHEGNYTCVIMVGAGGCGGPSITSETAVLTVNRNTTIGAPVISANPICQNGSTTITITATGDNLTYLWKKNAQPITGTNITGITTTALNISNALVSDGDVYTCTVTGACGSPLTSTNAVLTVNPTTAITTQPENLISCAGDEVLFTVAATGAGLTYQWMNGGAGGVPVVNGGAAPGAVISGATTNQLRISNVTTSEAGSYACVITGTCGNVNSSPASLTVNVPVIITVEPPTLTSVCQGTSAEINVTVTGTVSSYKWKKGSTYLTNSGNISGVFTNKLVIANTLLADAGYYSCEILSYCNNINTQSAELRVNAQTAITLQPVGATLCEGDNIQFMITAIGTAPLSYQWKLNNVNTGTNSSTLIVNNIDAGDAGAYTCVVTGGSTCGTATSNPANLIINPAINITVQPVNTTICQDNVATISLIANGTNLSYKWKYNGTYISDNGRITGTGTNQLRIALAKNSDEGIYKCEIFSACGSKESNSVVLSVTDSTKITSHPVNQTLLQGSTASFNVSATGAGLTYQWQKDNTDVPGATSSSYSIANVQPVDAGAYRCIVSGVCGQINSNLAILIVNQLVSITSQPASLLRCAGQSASFSVVATGTIVSYQWQFNGSDIVDGSGITGAKTANLVVSPVSTSHAGNYTCIVTGSTNIANSNVVNLTVNVLVSITLHPLSQTKCNGDILVLEVAPNDPALTYSWEFNGNPLTNGGRISGVNTSKLVISNVSNAEAGSYRCTLSNICISVTSNPATVTIDPVFFIISNPSNLSQCEGQTAFFSITTNISSVNYKWYLNGAPLSNTSRISGVNTANLIINNVVLADQGTYSCLISDNCSSANSASAVLTVKKVMVVNAQPSDKTVCEGENSFFEVNATGDNLVYQWQKNGVNLTDAGNIFGSGSSILIIQNTTIGDQGVYRCNITSGCNGILTNTANLTVNALPGAAGAISGDNTICQGDKNVLYVVPAISNATSYVWDLPYGTTIVSGNGTRSIQIDFSTISLSGVVSVHGVNGCGNGTESPFLPVTVNPIPLANAGSDQTLCSNAATFNANVTAFGTWTKLSGLASIVNPNLSNSAVTNLGQGSNLFVWTVSENGCMAKDSVVITNKQVFADAGTDQTICSLFTKLNANTPVVGSGNWSVISGGGLFSSVNDPKANVINLIRGTTILRWSINNGGCVSYDEMTIVNDLPNNSNAGLDTIILVNNYTLAGNNPAIGTGFWTLLSGSATITNPSQYNTTVTNLGIGVNTFQWTITKNLCYNQDAVKVINYTPTLTDAGPSQTLCVDRTSLMGTMPNYGTGQWSVIAGSGTFLDPSKFDTEVINIGKGQNIYRWTVYEYEITFDDVIITNNSPSTANAGIDQKLCDVNAILAGNNPFIGTGIWTLAGGSGTITNPGIYNSVVSNLGYGSNTFRWTIAFNGCSSYDEVVITNNKPTDADAGVDQVTCADSVNLYPNTPTIGTGEWSVVQGSAFFTGNKAFNLARNNNLFKWTISNNGCFDSDTVMITSNKPTISFTGADKWICVDSINLPGNTPAFGTGVWTMLNGSANFADVTDPKSKVTDLASGQNRFRWTITYNGCASYSEVDITYNYIQSDAGGDQTLCQSNAILSANDPGIGKGQWSIVGGSGSANFLNPNQSTTEVINLDKGTNILRWTITNSACISYNDVVITNNTPSTSYAGSDRSVCGEKIFLNANNPVIGTGEWIVLSGSANIENPTLYNSSVTNLSIGQNVLRWMVTNQNCTSSDEVIIKNDQPSNIDAGPDQYNCSASAQLYATAAIGGSGRWSISEGSASFQDNTLYNSMVSNLEKGENVLVWTVTIAGCSNSDTVAIANNLPSTPGAGPDQDLCADNAFMAANQPLIGTGRWSIVSGSAVFTDRALPNTNTTKLGNGTNVLRWTITNGSCILYDEVTITNSLPTVAYAGEDRAVCNTSANLLSAAPVSGTGSWSVVSGYGIFIDPKKFDTQIITLGFGPNTLRWTTENGRCRTSDDVIITNNLAEAYAGPDQIVYTSDIRLVGNKPASGTGQWIILAGRGTIANPSNFETNVSGLGGGANTFSWTINNGGCIASDDVVITNKILPVTDFNPLPGKGCAPLTVSFVNNSIGGAPFHWDFGDGVKSDATNTSHTYNVPGNYLVRLSSTGPDGIILHKDSVVVVYAIPVAQFKVTPDTAYIPGNSINFFNLTQNIDSLRWEFGDGNFSKEMNPSYKYNAVGSYDVTLHVWSGFQCYDSIKVFDAVRVELAGIIKCPNAFTPNVNGSTGGYYNKNDFSNDVFHCYIEGAAVYHLEIYNRLGIRLFESNDINIGWDGYFRGKLVEEGSYVFKVYGKFNNGALFDYFGNILLLH